MSWQENVTGYFQILESHGFLLFYQQAGAKGSRKKAADNQQISPTVAYWREYSSLKGTDLKTLEPNHEQGVPVNTRRNTCISLETLFLPFRTKTSTFFSTKHQALELLRPWSGTVCTSVPILQSEEFPFRILQFPKLQTFGFWTCPQATLVLKQSRSILGSKPCEDLQTLQASIHLCISLRDSPLSSPQNENSCCHCWQHTTRREKRQHIRSKDQHSGFSPLWTALSGPGYDNCSQCPSSIPSPAQVSLHPGHYSQY